MIFGIVLLIFVLLVAFIHFVQGFFSSIISLVLTIIAAAVSLGFHDKVVNALKGKFGDSLTALVLCSLFAVTYLILRMIFDRVVPGNVRLQSTIDKVGAAILGLAAGIIAAGILAIATQTMPFGPSIFGYSRYELGPVRKDVTFQPNSRDRAIGRDVVDEMKSPTYKEEDVRKLLVPADDIVLNLVNTLSNGSLSGSQRFNAIHANYLQEAFGTRVGIEIGAKHTAVNADGGDQISVDKIADRDRVKAVEDSELPEIREKKGAKKDSANLGQDEVKPAKEDLRATGTQKILIVRTVFTKASGEEKDSIARFTPASVRLVTHDSNGVAKNYYPLGTMDDWGGGTFWPNRIDDPLFIKAEDEPVDFVFMIDDLNEALEGAVAESPKKGKPQVTKAPTAIVMKPDVFLEVKHLARVDLGGRAVENAPLPPSGKPGIMRKVRMKAPVVPPA
jgi:hypothetical protein